MGRISENGKEPEEAEEWAGAGLNESIVVTNFLVIKSRYDAVAHLDTTQILLADEKKYCSLSNKNHVVKMVAKLMMPKAYADFHTID